jgi:hypothetical protein
LAKLYPEDHLQAARVDELLDALEDLSPKVYAGLFEKVFFFLFFLIKKLISSFTKKRMKKKKKFYLKI